MDETFEEYKDWLQDEADSYTKQMYLKAQAKLEKIKPYEDKLVRSGSEVIKLFSYSTQMSMKFILLINVKMPTTVGILAVISMMNTTSERLKARNLHFSVF